MTHLHRFLIKDLPLNAALMTEHYFLLLLLCLSAIAYYGYTIYAAIEFFCQTTKTDADFHPAITILKPMCGLDRNTYENLASFCRQDYPKYQIIFGVRDSLDPSVVVVKQIINDFPDLDIQLVVSDRTIGMNFKVSNLANAEALAKYSVLLIADSDIRVKPDYLRRVIQPMRDPTVGVVTCLYTSLTRGWIATFEAIGISTEFHAGNLVSRSLLGMNFALGSTIVIQRAALEAIGGWTAIADYLGDDFQLGNLPAQAGYKVELSDYLVEHVLPISTLTDSIQRQIRSYRGTRVYRRWGYLGLIFTYGTVTSLLFLVASEGSMLGWAVAGITWLTRLAMAWIVGVRCLHDPVAQKFLWLVPVRDLISFALWCYSFVGNTIQWRGRRLRLTKSGLLTPLTVRTSKVLPKLTAS